MTCYTTYGGRPCLDPAALYRDLVEHGLPVDFWTGTANSYRCTLNAPPGTGMVLLSRASLDALDLNAGHDLIISDDAGHATTLRRIQPVRARAVSPSTRDAGDTPFVLEIADRRVLLRGRIIDRGYNLRAYGGGAYLTPTLGGVLPWTWAGLAYDLWAAVGVADLGAFPGLPFTPDGTPEGFGFWQADALESLCAVLIRIGCALKYDPVADTFGVVRAGADDPVWTATEKRKDAARVWDEEFIEPARVRLPQYVRVAFRKAPRPADGSGPWQTVDVADVAPDPNFQLGSRVVLPDDLPALLDGAGAVTNAAALASRAAERAADWFRQRKGLTRLLRQYPGALPDAGLMPGAKLTHEWWGDVGRGVKTEIARRPPDPWAMPPATLDAAPPGFSVYGGTVYLGGSVLILDEGSTASFGAVYVTLSSATYTAYAITSSQLIVTPTLATVTFLSFRPGSSSGQLLVLRNASTTNTISLSAVGFITPGGVDYLIPAGASAWLSYDTVSGLWAVVTCCVGLVSLTTGVTGTLPVPYGGTGLTTTIPNGLFTGGTTPTAALQQIPSLGTTGQVLTSQGTGSLPAWTTPTAGVADGDYGDVIVTSGGTIWLIDATWPGSTGLTTLGTITTGVWNGTTIAAAYLPTLDAVTAPVADVSINSHKLTNVTDPVSAQDAATKAYVDAVASGLSVRGSVRVATTTAGTLASSFANGQTVDGVTLATGDRILIKDQVAGADNGIWTVNASGAPTRATDADTSPEVVSGLFVFVTAGTVNAASGWVLTTANPITLGTTALTWSQFSGAGTYTAGTGLFLSGSQFNAFFGTTSGTVCQGNDSRLSDARTPVGTALTSAKIWVGNGSNVAAAVPVTGDVTMSNAGVTAIGAAKVTSAMLRDSAALSVVGRSANSTGVPADIAATAASAAVLRESGSTIGFGTVATAGIADNAVTNVKIRQSAGLSVPGRSATTTGNVADITGTSDQVLRVGAGTAAPLGFGALNLSATGVSVTGILAVSVGGTGVGSLSALATALIGVGIGSVTSVALSVPSGEFNVSGSPVTSSGTFNVDWNSQSANLVLASPNGSTGAPSFRKANSNDLAASGVTAGTYAVPGQIPIITVDASGIVTDITMDTDIYVRYLDNVLFHCLWEGFVPKNAALAGSRELSLAQLTIYAHRVSPNGDKLRFVMGGKFAASATATRRIRTYLDTSTPLANPPFFDSGNLSTTSATDWRLSVDLVYTANGRLTSPTQSTFYVCTLLVNGQSPLVSCGKIDSTVLDWTVDTVLSVTGQAAGTGADDADIGGDGPYMMFWEPASPFGASWY